MSLSEKSAFIENTANLVKVPAESPVNKNPWQSTMQLPSITTDLALNFPLRKVAGIKLETSYSSRTFRVIESKDRFVQTHVILKEQKVSEILFTKIISGIVPAQ